MVIRIWTQGLTVQSNLLMMKHKSILFVEDDLIVSTHIASTLQMLFRNVYCAQNGEEGFNMYEDSRPDIVLTDIQMPRQDGMKLITQIRRIDYATPIVILTGYDDKHLVLKAANLAVDGYLIKPVEFSSLVKTLSQAIKRMHNTPNLITLNEHLFFNRDTKEFYYNNAIYRLSTKELELVELLIDNHHRILSKQDIELSLWNRDIPCESAVKNLVLRIRKKLGDTLIFSQRGLGYRININDARYFGDMG